MAVDRFDVDTHFIILVVFLKIMIYCLHDSISGFKIHVHCLFYFIICIFFSYNMFYLVVACCCVYLFGSLLFLYFVDFFSFFSFTGRRPEELMSWRGSVHSSVRPYVRPSVRYVFLVNAIKSSFFFRFC